MPEIKYLEPSKGRKDCLVGVQMIFVASGALVPVLPKRIAKEE